MDSKTVKYVCTCGKAAALAYLHFCRHCFRIRCSSCLYHEVDVICCPTCLDNQGREECAYRQNRCTSCFSCPNCCHTLSVRGTVVARLQGDTNASSQQQQQRVFYLMCVNCRWSSRDAGIRDSNSATGGWMEEPNPNTTRIHQLNECYNLVSSKEKMLKERHTYIRKRSALIHERKSLGFPSYSRRVSTLPGTNTLNEPESTTVDIPGAVASEDVPDLDFKRFIEEPLEIEKVTGIFQRLMACDRQPELMSQLFPKHTTFIANRSMRCRDCEHNVRKHDLISKSMKFKINSNALYHVPQIKVARQPTPWQSNKKEKLTITIFNPVTRITTVSLAPVQGETDNFSTAKLTLTDAKIPIAGRSDATDLGAEAPAVFKDDPEIVAFRQNNKIGLTLQCTPMVSTSKPVKVAFSLEFDVKNTFPTSSTTGTSSSIFSMYKPSTKEEDNANKETVNPNDTMLVKVKVLLDLGNVGP